MKIDLFYDKECPFCKSYAKYNKLKSKHDITIYNARESHDKIKEFRQKGFDINDGVIIEIDGEILQGADAAIKLNELSSSKFPFLDTKLFKNYLYPFVKLIRKLVLFILRIDPKIK